MTIGIAKEIKIEENRVAATPKGVRAMVKKGAKVLVERGAGEGSGFSNEEYEEAGAQIVERERVWQADIVVKIKEPLESEYQFFRNNLTIFTYLHLANPELKELTEKLMQAGVTAIAYETVQLPDGSLPLLMPMSEVAGKMAPQIGAHFLRKPQGGEGKLLGRVKGVEPATVVIVGGGNVGKNAAKMALGMGAKVILLDIKEEKLAQIKEELKGDLETLISNEENLNKVIPQADLLVGAVLVPGAKAPKVVKEEMVQKMKKGSVIVDVAIDQGGCVATSHPTSHKNPVFEKYGVLHYCVTNMPGAVARTSTLALTSATLPYVLEMIEKGVGGALRENESLRKGLNVYKGKVRFEAVAKAHNLEYAPFREEN